MSIREQIDRQRVKHIVSSYQLAEPDETQFSACLTALLHSYPLPLVELALVETIVDGWAAVPLVRGLAFLKQVHDKLKVWESGSIASTITPAQFQQITGLDPSPIFGANTTEAIARSS
ncbi:MAG: hypothetical protein F6K28_60810 [Microcoleus sp. SIO2G3]|nr:hypothetical protein [Microcoleus sp. SIO2G3]